MNKLRSFLNILLKFKTEILYTFIFIASVFILVVILKQPGTRNFFSFMEARTFDLRQVIISEKKQVNKNIVIVTVDDASYEYLISKYGDWPVPRDVYAGFIEYVEAQNPAFIAFDLLFVKSLRSKPNSDNVLTSTMAKYDNVYTAINFDDQTFEYREPVALPDYLKADISIESENFAPQLYSNCRAILSSIINGTKNIGHINTPKERDGITRTIPLFIRYPQYKKEASGYKQVKVDYYPYMTLKIAKAYLNKIENEKIDKFIVDKDNNLILGKRKIPMSYDGEIILNWYGESGLNTKKTFTYVPLWKIIDSIENKEKHLIPEGFFKDKIVYLGTSVFALSDVKAVPTEKYLPGVELHATLLNNILDNSIIKKADLSLNITVTLVVSALVAIFVAFSSSTFISLIASILTVVGYLFISTYVMEHFNLWIWTVMPIIAVILTFIALYLVKYIIKSRDFEHTYKLATTDGLTELYNHRFFQEQMILNIEQSKKTKSHFSLILLDIDFFKKFNDAYGHQSGDAVLKQVATVLKKTVRSSDIVCRYGGEEMAVILPGVNEKEARITAQKICDAVASKTFKLANDMEKNVTISLGVATYPQNGKTPSTLIEYSDKGLYAAKENGRNQVGKITSDMGIK